MIIFTKFEKDLLETSSVALGVFDGVHIAHQKIFDDVISKSKKYGSTPCVITFSNHPQNVLGEKKIENIISVEKKLELFEKFGIEAVVMLEFTTGMASLPADDYLKMIAESLHPASITLGFNHSFGACKRGNGEFLKKHEPLYGYETAVIEPVNFEGHIVSSSLIRNLLTEGNISLANKMLGRDFSVEGKIVTGAQKGRTIGFPTINLKLADGLIAPKNGVYGGYVRVCGEVYKAAINVGHAPTFNYSEEIVVEAHLFDFSKDVYFEHAEVFFTKHIRDEKKFSSVDELKENISKDCSLILGYEMKI